MPPRFVILIPAFHVEAYIERALRSALDQDYAHFRIMFVEDHGADGTLRIGLETIAAHPVGHRVVHWSNVERQGPLGNHVAMIAACQDHEIAVCLDGDDQLAGPHVLRRLAEVYADPEIWMTYGSYEYDEDSRNPNGDARGISSQIPPEQHTRHAVWTASHLKTFYTWLFRRIRTEDLQFHGAYIDTAGDVVMMMPMIEMAGPRHARFIAETLYLYNGRNPMNEAKVRPTFSRAILNEVLRRPIYAPLEQRP